MNEKLKLEIYEFVAEFKRIGNEAIKIAQEENRKKGIPNAYLFSGSIIYELPDGTITKENPFTSQGKV
ncbi:MAG: hypothetical protein ACE5PV_15325 [Candidatus Poribacteria bacterium]